MSKDVEQDLRVAVCVDMPVSLLIQKFPQFQGVGEIAIMREAYTIWTIHIELH